VRVSEAKVQRPQNFVEILSSKIVRGRVGILEISEGQESLWLSFLKVDKFSVFMLFDANFRLDEQEPKLRPFDFDIVELIRRNELGRLDLLGRLVPIIVRTLHEINGYEGTIMALPFGGDCMYCLTDPENPDYASGGFVYEQGNLFFARRLINMQHDRDGFRTQPTNIKGNYSTDLTFRETVLVFQQNDIPLYRTVAEAGVYYDKKSWPDGKVPNFGSMNYCDALRELGL